MNKFQFIKEYCDRYGWQYGSENKALFFYSLTKMFRPRTVIELGAGYGVVTFMIGEALRLNGEGTIYSYDNGSQSRAIMNDISPEETIEDCSGAYFSYLNKKIEDFELGNYVKFINAEIPPYPSQFDEVDIVFSDFVSSPAIILQVLATYLPLMVKGGSIFFDSCASHFSCYSTIEFITERLNSGKIPLILLEGCDEELREKFALVVKNSRFTLKHINDVAKKTQNTFSWLQIEPADLVPHPRTNIMY